MTNDIEFEVGEYGSRAVIKSSWQDNYLKLLLDNDVSELELNHGKGWVGNSVDFLKLLPNLKSFTILDFGSALKSIEAVHYLGMLRELNISTYCKTPVNFNSFPNLEKCNFEWRKGSESLFSSLSLKNLFLNSYDRHNSNVFLPLTNLQHLGILNSSIEDIVGLSSLINLKKLRLGNLKNIISLDGIDKLYQLEELNIQRCRGVRSISCILKLRGLKKLSLIDLGNIESIRGLENLAKLETFLFYESTNIIDGDLSPLQRLQSLSKISFQNRKHYNLKREHFGKLYSS